MSGAVDFFEAILSAEEENRNTYDIYGQLTDQYSARNLLATLEAASRDRLDTLRRFSRRDDVTTLLADVSEVDLGGTGDSYGFDAGMQYADFLQLICRRESALTVRYRAIHDASGNDEVRRLFGRMAEDCERRHRLARTRYELETLV
ncbi:MAG: hypothetical protein EA403_16770 [Spirochaetaceae bacterium]|nr:MAG: hypothetical protein EA403_16770 [Spirochaetaceae bacterium]